METVSFLKRALAFQVELQRKAYPNATTLAERWECSRSTAMRTIDRLRYEFGVPIAYDESERGYYLTNPDFSFTTLPLGRDELVALLLAGELASLIEDTALQGSISSLWNQTTAGRSDVQYDLTSLRQCFTSDATSIAKLADINVLKLLSYCHQGQPVEIRYRSPWRHEEDRTYCGVFERLHFSDGILYALFLEQGGRRLVLNMSFLRGITELPELPRIHGETAPHKPAPAHWLEGFGVWAGAKPEQIEIVIAAPASRYYAAQSWHSEQEDRWDGENLIRTFPGIPSPELARRILSLGRYVVSVTPSTVLEQLRDDVAHLGRLCAGG